MNEESTKQSRKKASRAVISETQRKRRLWLKWAAVVVLFMTLLAAVAFYFATGWRARDLARKARESLDRGDYRGAFLQLFSARRLRPEDPAVVRSGAVLEGRAGWKTSLELWDQLARQVELSDQDRLERTVATLKLGTDEQFAKAVREFEQSGDMAKACALRHGLAMDRGFLTEWKRMDPESYEELRGGLGTLKSKDQ